MQHPLPPKGYEHILQADDIEKAWLVDQDYVKLIDLREANPKDECDRLISQHRHDSRRLATLTLGTIDPQRVDDTTRKRRRTGAASSILFPTTDPTDTSGKRINQGYGGDLSFPTACKQDPPTVCKQSAKFIGFTDDLSGKWEVSSLTCHQQVARK